MKKNIHASYLVLSVITTCKRKDTEVEDLSTSLASGVSPRSWKLAEPFTFSDRISKPSAVLREYEFLYELCKK